jgi:hypothetical protein
MNHPLHSRAPRRRWNERGASRLSFLVIVLALAAVAYVAYQLVPLYYNASLYKVYMKDTVDKAAATGKDPEWVKTQLRSTGAEEYGVPPTAVVESNIGDGRINARVRYTRPIDFKVYVYQYSFDHPVKSDKFLSSQ